MRALSLSVVVISVVASLNGIGRAEPRSAVRAAVRAAQTFEVSKDQASGRWVEMHKHSFLGIPFGKLTAHQALVRVVKGKSVVLTPMETRQKYYGRGMGPVPVDAPARPSAKVRSAAELAKWASYVGLRYVSFQPEKQMPAPPAVPLPNISGLMLIRGLDLTPADLAPRTPVRIPSMVRGLN